MVGEPRRTGHQLWRGSVLKTSPGAEHFRIGDELEFEEAHVVACTVRPSASDIQRSIAAVLLEEWDPIGVSDVPEAADEYDAYVGEIYRLITSRADAETLARRLSQIETNRMGLAPSDATKRLEVAQHLLAIDTRFGRGAG